MKQKRSSLMHSENLFGWAFIAPIMLIFLGLTAFPFFFSMFLSFVEWSFFSGLEKLKYVGLDNFSELLGNAYFWDSLGNTFIYVITIVPLSIILSLVFADQMNDKVYGKKYIRMMYFVPYVSAIVAVGAVFKMLFRTDGIINGFLANLNLIGKPIAWLADDRYAKIPIILLSIWSSIGYQMILLTAALQNVPVELYEAARMDGANGLKQFCHVTVPMISPTIFYLLITRTMAVFKIFSSVNVMTLNMPSSASRSIVVLIYEKAFTKYQFGLASAMSFILFIIILIVTGLNFLGQKKWVHY